MPAYDRFWDLAVTTGVHYDFTEEIVPACIYQREVKQQNNVRGKALIAFPDIKKWQTAAAQFLNKIPASELILDCIATDLMNAMSGDFGTTLRRKNLFNDNGIQAGIARRFTKFTLADELSPRFDGTILRKAASGYSLVNAPITDDRQVMIINLRGRPSLDRLPEGGYGYLATAASMEDIQDKKSEPYFRDAVSWILGGGAAKIRITCHGDGEGNLEMLEKTTQETLKVLSADCLPKWLHANGLTERRNLRTINMNMCMAAKFNLTPAVIKAGQYSPAEGSAVELVARTLGALGIHGVRVTGSNEVVSGIDEASLDPSQEDKYLTPVGTGRLVASQNVRQIEIPGGEGFSFKFATMTMTLPSGWTIQPRQKQGSQLFALRPPLGWRVEKVESKIPRPSNFAAADFLVTGPKGKPWSISSQGWMVEGREVISTEGWTLASRNSLKFEGTGGTIALQGKEGPGQTVRIMERIAKSRAKAVAIS